MGIDKVSLPTRLLTGSLSGIGKKSIIAGVVAAVTAGVTPSAYADIELGEGLSATGFADMSFVYFDVDGEPSEKVFGIDQFEIDFLYSGSAGISAQVDLEYGTLFGESDHAFVEQAFITKAVTDQFSVKAGRFLSYSGWETEEPTGLFQYSGTGYAPYFYGYYQQGVSAYYDGGMFAVMGSVVTDAVSHYKSPGDSLERNTKDLGYEVGVAVTPLEGFTAKLFYISQKYDFDGGEGEGFSEKHNRINFWTSYAVGSFTFAGEYNKAKYGDGDKGNGYLLMANYASGPFGITARYHEAKFKYEGETYGKTKGYTLSPSYAVGDNLLLVAEYRRDNWGGGVKSNAVALEALFTF